MTETIPALRSKSNGKITTEINVIHLQPCRASLDYIFSYFATTDIQESLCEEDRGGAFIHGICDQFMAGKYTMLVPMVDGQPAGLFYGYMMNCCICEVHQGVYREFRRYSVQLGKLMVEKGFEVTGAEHMMGITPVTFRGAALVALRSGFKNRGIIPNYFNMNGKLVDGYIFTQERPK